MRERLSPTRRGFLGAMAVAPMMIAAPATFAQPSRSRWEARLKEWREYDAYFNAHCDEEPDDPRSCEHDVWEESNAIICERHENMLRELMAEPTPDANAFREKVAIYKRQYYPGYGDPIFAVLDDAVRWAESGVRHA